MKKKSLKITPIILIALGAIFLLNNFGILPWGIWTNLWKFWPILLILLGIEYFVGQSISLRTLLILLILIFLLPIIFAVNPFTKNPLTTDELKVSEEVGTLAKAKILIELPATNINVKADATSSHQLIKGELKYSKAVPKPTLTREERFGQAIITIKQVNEIGIPFLSGLKNNTDIVLNQQIPLELVIKSGAARGTLDLKSLRMDYLEVDSTASDLTINFDSLYSSRAVLKTSASNLKITIPKNIETRIKLDSKVKSLSIDSRFKDKGGGEYKTDGFDKAFIRLDIQIEAVASSINIQ